MQENGQQINRIKNKTNPSKMQGGQGKDSKKNFLNKPTPQNTKGREMRVKQE